MRILKAVIVFFLAAMFAAAAAAETRTLKVKLNYTGAGKVSEQARIFLFVFDNMDFMKSRDVMPIGMKSASAKDETVVFDDLSASPVYIVAAFDPNGVYDAQSGPPPSGSSLGLYMKDGAPEGIKIEPGKTAEIVLAFDDTIKMP